MEDTKTITLLAAFKQYINSVLDDNFGAEEVTISRINLMNGILAIDDKFDERTIDVYRAYFTAAGYIVIKGRGQYAILKPIPKDLTMASLHDERTRKSNRYGQE